jgi:membrane fusion protein (multidrug efflux system)
MKRKIFLAVIIVLVIFGALAGIKALQISKLVAAGKAFAPPPETISSAVAHEEKWQDSLTAVGSISAVQGITIAPEIPGTVSEIAFESGAIVAKDALLLRLDTSSEAAQLRAIEAQVELWELNANRARQLWTNSAISKADLDAAESTLKEGKANADVIRTTIEKKTIRAPFAGRTGIRQVNLGEFIDKARPIVSLQSLSPLFGDFSLPQQEFARLKVGMKVRVSTDTFPDRRFDGVLTAINPDLDPVMRSVRVQATFENAEQLLRAGMFARFEVLLPGEENVLAIPATSILSAPYGDSVYVIEPATNMAGGLVVRQQFVRTGRAFGDFVSVQTGLKAGERVVNSGLFKLRNGMSVMENNDLKPKTAEQPRPPNS